MAEIDDIVAWGEANQDKAGTPEFVQKAERFKQLKSGAAPPTPSVASIDEAPIGGIPSASKLGAIRAEDSPNSAANIAQRAVINRYTAIPDLGIALGNIGSRYGIFPETKLPYLGSTINRALGGQDMPADAPWYQRVGEGFMSMKPSAVAAAPVRTLGVTGTSIAGAEGGAALGQATGLDPELLAILGGVGGGGGPRAVGNVSRDVVSNLYGAGKGRLPIGNMPGAGEIYDTAVRSGVTPTMDLVGNQAARDQWAALRSQPGSQNTIREAGRNTRREITQAAQEVPNQAGATMRRGVDIGQAAQGTADTALNALEQRNSARQGAMETQIGPQTPVNVADLDRLMSRIPGQTTPEVSGPITNRLNTLRSMYPAPDENVQGPPAPVVDYGRLKDWRGNLLNQSEGYPAVTGHQATDIKALARQLMQDTAEQQGVPPGQFNSVQAGSTRLMEQTPRLEPLTPRAGTDYGAVHRRLLEGGEQNPTMLRDFRRDVNNAVGQPAGNPQVNNLYASHLNNLIDTVLNYRGGSALGPTNFADRLRSMADDSLRQLTGTPQGYQRMRDVETLGQALHRPTESGGGQAAAGNVAGQATADFGRAALGGTAALLGGMEPTSAATASLFAKSLGRPIDYARAQLLNSPSAVAGAAGRPTPFLPGVDVNDIRAALQAIQGSTPRGPVLGP